MKKHLFFIFNVIFIVETHTFFNNIIKIYNTFLAPFGTPVLQGIGQALGAPTGNFVQDQYDKRLGYTQDVQIRKLKQQRAVLQENLEFEIRSENPQIKAQGKQTEIQIAAINKQIVTLAESKEYAKRKINPIQW